ncbi:LysR substrate-binding domain-containing protein, partial [Pseudomonas aeruginosa]|nr:LysR family transcriptional regulator [Pseudomonas aeruginosa]
TREEVSHALLGHLHYLEDSLDLGSSEAIKHSVAAGLGISCLSRWVVEEQLASGALVELRSSLPPLRRRFYMLRQRDKFLSPGFERFWEHCRAGLGAG